jgi:hypothetical protein
MGQTTIDEILLKNAQSAIDDVKKMGISRNSLSDGHHTFGELYHHRAVLFSMICNQNKERAWKSLLHHNSEDEMFEGMFIVGINTPYGQVTYHYDLPEWDLFKVKELDRAPKWDGSTPDDCIERMKKWSEN